MKLSSLAPLDLDSHEGRTWLLITNETALLHLSEFGTDFEVIFSANELPKTPFKGDRLLVLGSKSEHENAQGDDTCQVFSRWLEVPGTEALWVLPLGSDETFSALRDALSGEGPLEISALDVSAGYLWLEIGISAEESKSEIVPEAAFLSAVELFGSEERSADNADKTLGSTPELPSIRSQIIMKVTPLLKPLKQRLPKNVVVALYKILEKIR